MTSPTQFGVPLNNSERGGILQPQVAYRFRILPLNIGGENSQIFCQQVESCKLDLTKKMLTIDVRQSVTQGGFDAVAAVVADCKNLVVDYLDSSAEVNFSLVIAVESMAHELTMNYGVSANLMHRLVVKFSEYETMAGNKPEVKPYPMIHTGTDEFITPAAAINLIDTVTKKVEEPTPKPVKTKNVKRQTDKG